MIKVNLNADILKAILIPFIFILITNSLISFKLINFSNSFAFLRKLGSSHLSKSRKETKDSDQTFSLNKQGGDETKNSSSNTCRNKVSKEIILRKKKQVKVITLEESDEVRRTSVKPNANIILSLDVEHTFIKKDSSIVNASVGPKIHFQDINSAEELIIKKTLNKNMLIKNSISNVSKRMQNYSKTLKILFTISTTFLLLNCPMTINKFWYFFKYRDTSFYETNLESPKALISNQSMTFFNYRPLQISNSGLVYFFEKNGTVYNMSFGADEISINDSYHHEFNLTFPYEKEKHEKSDGQTDPLEEIFERISCYLYYLNFPLNFFLYSTSGSKFRNAFISMFRRENLNKTRFSSTYKSNKLDNTQHSTTVNFHRTLV